MKISWPVCRAALLSAALCVNVFLPLTAAAQGRLRRPLGREGADAPALRLASATLPAGTLLLCEVVTRLDSKTAQEGDVFRARVSVPTVDDQGRTLVPRESIVAGRVEFVQRAQTRRRPGLIEVSFDEIIIGGQSYPLNAMLAPTDGKDQLRVDDEGNVRGRRSTTKRTIGFIGGGAGAGALVGAFTAGAVLGLGVGAVVGVAASLLAKGKQAVAEPGMKIGVELNQPLALRGGAVYSDESQPETATEAPRPRPSTYENPPPPGFETPPATRPRPTNTETPRPRPTPRPTAGSNSTGATASNKPQNRPAPRPAPVVVKPDEPVDTSELQMLNVSNLLAERGTDGKLRVSITGQAPTAGWKLAPEQTVENGILQIKLKGVPPQGMAAQVISYPTKVVVVDDPDRQIQRVTVRGQTTSRSTVPLTRGSGGGTVNSGPGGGASNESYSTAGTRIADKMDMLVEDFARLNLALRRSDGTYSFEDPRAAERPEGLLLLAFDRLAESARVFRGSLTPEVSRRAVRELTNGVAQANRILPSTRLPADITQRWQGIQREINQLAGGQPAAR